MNKLECLHLTNKLLNVYAQYCVPVCQKYQISQTSFDIMMFLANNPKYNTAKDICDIRGIKKGNVSVMVEHLIQKGYLTRVEDSEDRRIVRLFVTDRAADMISAGEAAQKAYFRLLSKNLTKEELNVCNRVLEKLNEEIEGVLK